MTILSINDQLYHNLPTTVLPSNWQGWSKTAWTTCKGYTRHREKFELRLVLRDKKKREKKINSSGEGIVYWVTYWPMYLEHHGGALVGLVNVTIVNDAMIDAWRSPKRLGFVPVRASCSAYSCIDWVLFHSLSFCQHPPTRRTWNGSKFRLWKLSSLFIG